MKHERRLDVAGVDAMDKVEVGVEPCGQPETAPLGGDHQHAEAHAQLAREDADDVDIAAVRVGDHHFAQARAVHAFADLDPDAHEIIGRMGDRAGGAQMLVGFSDRLRRQNQHAEIVGQARQHGLDQALADGGIGQDRQVRPVLLGRGDRQDCHRRIRIERGKFARLELRPEPPGSHYPIARIWPAYH